MVNAQEQGTLSSFPRQLEAIAEKFRVLSTISCILAPLRARVPSRNPLCLEALILWYCLSGNALMQAKTLKVQVTILNRLKHALLPGTIFHNIQTVCARISFQTTAQRLDGQTFSATLSPTTLEYIFIAQHSTRLLVALFPAAAHHFNLAQHALPQTARYPVHRVAGVARHPHALILQHRLALKAALSLPRHPALLVAAYRRKTCA